MRWFALGAALLLAGCASPAAPVATTPSAPASSPTLPPLGTPAFDPPVVAAQLATPMAEPMATTDPQGRIFADASGNDVVVRSDDGGRTWSTVAGLAAPEDGALASGPSGTLYGSGLAHNESGGLDITFARSLDGGKSWGPRAVLAHGNVDRQWFASGSPGHVVGVWRDRNAADDAFTAVRVSDDDGLTWGEATRLVPGQSFPGSIIAGTDGSYYVAYTPYDKYAPRVARSVDGGRTWNATEAAPTGGNIPVIAQDDNGTLYLVYWRYTGEYVGGPTGQPIVTSQVEAWLVVSHDHAASWSKPIRVSPADRNAALPWIVAGAPGRIAIAWYEDSLGGSRTKPDSWHTVLTVSSDADSETPHFASAPTSASPSHVGQLCGECGVRTTCLPVVLCPGYYGPGSPRSRLDFLGLTLAKDGTPVIVYDADRSRDPAAMDLVAARPSNVRLR